MKSTLGQMLATARKGGYAVAAINILNHLTLSAVLEAAVRKNSPVIIQTSVATVKAMKPAALGNLARLMIDAAPIPAVLHLDHCRDVEMCNMCCELGWDSVMFDGSHLSFEENIRQSRLVRLYAQNKGVDVEGEVGIIAGVEDDISHDAGSLAGFEQTMQYIEKTSVDAIAPAIGTAHGVYTGKPAINFDLVRRLSDESSCPVVVHGGTGLDDEVFRKLIHCGTTKINISTALKLVYTGSARKYLVEHSNKINPLDFDAFVFEEVAALAGSFMTLFGSEGKADFKPGRRIA